MISKAEVPRTRSSWPPSRTRKEPWNETVLCERCGHPLGSEVSKRKGTCGMCDRESETRKEWRESREE